MYNNQALEKSSNGMWLSLVERLVWDQDAAGSNPVIPTTRNCLGSSFFVFQASIKRCPFHCTGCPDMVLF